MRRWLGGSAAQQSITRSEAFRVLRANLEVALARPRPGVVIVTSAHEGEGKTATCAQIARSFVDAGRGVVVVDLDLRHPDLHNWFDVDNVRGASDVLTERCRLDEALQQVELPPVQRQPTAVAVRPHRRCRRAERHGAARRGRTVRLLDALSEQADVLLIDTPPVLPVADTSSSPASRPARARGR